MGKIIRISDEIFTRLQSHAEPLVDTPARVIERVLDFYEAHHGKEGDGPQGSMRAAQAKLLTPIEFAEEAGVTPGHIRNLIRQGKIAGQQDGRYGRWSIPYSELEKMKK